MSEAQIFAAVRTKLCQVATDIACWLGRHKWKLSFYAGRTGFAFGDRCPNCDIWHKDSIRKAREEEVCNGFDL